MASNVEYAAFNLATDYGIKKLAAELDTSESVLRKQLDPKIDTHRLSLATAHKISILTGSQAILKAMADDMGSVVVPLPGEVDLVGDGIFDRSVDLSEKLGATMAKLRAIYADRKITREEKQEFHKDIMELVTSALQLDFEADDMANGV